MNMLTFAIGHINKEINHLESWGDPCGLDFNAKKFMAILLGSDVNLNACSKLNFSPIHVNGKVIKLT